VPPISTPMILVVSRLGTSFYSGFKMTQPITKDQFMTLNPWILKHLSNRILRSILVEVVYDTSSDTAIRAARGGSLMEGLRLSTLSKMDMVVYVVRAIKT
jgi:hypothetical protein